MFAIRLAFACAPACPEAGERFRPPNLTPEQAFADSDRHSGDPELVPCSDGQPMGSDHVDVWCTPEWCVDGYVGNYCVLEAEFDDWEQEVYAGPTCASSVEDALPAHLAISCACGTLESTWGGVR